MFIIGAGLSGLIAANMLASYLPTIWEEKPSLPNNHSAVLRFRSSVLGDVLNIPFRKVQLIKATLPWRNPVADALAYSFKNTGFYRSDRSITNVTATSGGGDDNTRWIAPENLVDILARNVSIRCNQSYDGESYGEPIISTIPMPLLIKLLDYPSRGTISFNYVHGKNIHAKIRNCDAFVSLINPSPLDPWSRVSITGDDLIVEGNDSLSEGSLVEVAFALGFSFKDYYDVSIHDQFYAKITPIDDNERKRFLAWATDNHSIYSLGRFATWRPKLLLDDLVKDIRLIERWAFKHDRYHLKQQQ